MNFTNQGFSRSGFLQPGDDVILVIESDGAEAACEVLEILVDSSGNAAFAVLCFRPAGEYLVTDPYGGLLNSPQVERKVIDAWFQKVGTPLSAAAGAQLQSYPGRVRIDVFDAVGLRRAGTFGWASIFWWA